MASLTVRYGRSETAADPLSFGLTVEVVNAVDMPKKIFMVKRSTPSATDPEMATSDVLDEFSHIALPTELNTVPEDAPEYKRTGSWFRVNYWEFTFRSMDELEESLKLLRLDIKKLVSSINANLRINEYLEETYE